MEWSTSSRRKENLIASNILVRHFHNFSKCCTKCNQNTYIKEEQTTQWSKEKVQKDKQRSTKHTYKTKDRVTRTRLKTGGELRCSGRVGSSSSTSDTHDHLIHPDRIYLSIEIVKLRRFLVRFCRLMPIVLNFFIWIQQYFW
jgi:hypothetical protein